MACDSAAPSQPSAICYGQAWASRHPARLLWIKPASFSGKQICGAETRSAPLGICSSEGSARPRALLLTLRGFLVAQQMLNHSSRHRSCGTRGGGVQGGHKAPGGVQGQGRQAHRRGHRGQQRHARPHRTGTGAAGLTDHGMSSRGYLCGHLCGVLTYGAGAMWGSDLFASHS